MQEKKPSGLFINCPEAQDSIFESGKMVFQCLQDSDKFLLDYIEVDIENRSVPANYDFYLFNYHIVTMTWLDTKRLRKSLPGLKMTIVLEVSPNDPFVLCSPDDFDAYCVLDPTLNIKQRNVFAFPRPLETTEKQFTYEHNEIPVIGSFGFATQGKGFNHVIDAINREFECAVVKINIPYSTYDNESGKYAEQLGQMCRARAKSGIEIIVTHDFMSKPDLIKWCSQNAINCFLYDRNQPGLAATTDQAISSGRPLITSKNNTFRHIQKFIKPFPYQTLRSAIETSQQKVEQIQKEWSPEKFREKFEEVLNSFQFDNQSENKINDSLSLLPILKKSDLPAPLQKIKKILGIRTRLGNFKKGYGFKLTAEIKSKPAISYSQFGEDEIISNLLAEMKIQNMRYLDIGANNPKYISNTYLFYEKGFNGVLVEPNTSLCEKLKAVRPRDVVLNVGIGTDENISEADFYLFPEAADGLSTFSPEEARHWEEVGMGGKKFKVEKVIKMPLVVINDIIADNFTECPDFISIDVEGWDLKILKTLNFEKYSPAVFCVETLAYNEDGSTYRIKEIYEFMESKGYFSFQQTYANDIFVNKNLYDFYIYQKNNNKNSG